jgi:hypothetical protein
LIFGRHDSDADGDCEYCGSKSKPTASRSRQCKTTCRDVKKKGAHSGACNCVTCHASWKGGRFHTVPDCTCCSRTANHVLSRKGTFTCRPLSDSCPVIGSRSTNSQSLLMNCPAFGVRSINPDRAVPDLAQK